MAVVLCRSDPRSSDLRCVISKEESVESESWGFRASLTSGFSHAV